MKENKKVVRFLVAALGLWLVWFVLYDVWLNSFDSWLALRVAEGSTLFLDMIGYRAETQNSVVLIDGEAMVYIGAACNGMVLMALFAGFIVAFPGPWLKKIFFIPLGIIVINLLNIFRVAALALNSFYSSHTLEFNHKYTFTIIVYACIFILWMLWVKRFSTLHNHGLTTSSHKQQAA